MLDISHKTFSFKKQFSIDEVECLLVSPEKIFNTFTPDLPSYLQIKNMNVDKSSIRAEFITFFPIELNAILYSRTSKNSSLLKCQLDFYIKGGSAAKDKIFNNVKRLRVGISYTYETNRLSVRLQYEKGDSPSSALLHNKALDVISRQTKPIAKAFYSYLS